MNTNVKECVQSAMEQARPSRGPGAFTQCHSLVSWQLFTMLLCQAVAMCWGCSSETQAPSLPLGAPRVAREGGLGGQLPQRTVCSGEVLWEGMK